MRQCGDHDGRGIWYLRATHRFHQTAPPRLTVPRPAPLPSPAPLPGPAPPGQVAPAPWAYLRAGALGGGTPCFRRRRRPQGPAPSGDVISGFPTESEVGTLWLVRLSRVVAAGPSGSGKRAHRLRGGSRGVCTGCVLPAERQFRPLHFRLLPVPCPALS